MSNIKISQLNNATTPLAGTEVVPIVQSGATKKVSVSNIVAGKQDTLVSGTNIKTINGSSVLGSGDLVVGGSGLKGYNAMINISSGNIISTNIIGGSFFTVNLVANRLYASCLLLNENLTTSNLFINNSSTVGGANVRILIYSDLNGLPDQKIYESSNLDCSTLGIKTATTTQNFLAGTKYWICLYGNSTNQLSFHSQTTLPIIKMLQTGYVSSYYTTATFGSAPTTFGTPTDSSSATPFIGITKA